MNTHNATVSPTSTPESPASKWRPDLPVDDVLLVLIVSLVVAGIVCVFSASYPEASKPHADGSPGNPYKFLIQQTIYALAGGLACAIFAYISPARIRRWALFGVGAALGLMLAVFIPHVGVAMGGARRWIHLGPFLFQPSEMAKVALIAFVAWRVSQVRDWATGQYRVYAASMLATVLFCGLCVLQRDLGSAVVTFSVVFAALFFAGVNARWLGATCVAAVLGALCLARMEPYRWERITAFLHPTRDTGDTSYHIARMLVTLSRGGLFGQGLGLSREKWLALPARHTDSIFSVIGAELGFVGAVALVLTFLFLVRRTILLARRQPDTFSAVLTAGLGSAIGIQAFINMGVACGLLPCTGLTLPFISAGGSSLVCTLIASGMLLSLSRQAAPGSGGGEASASSRPSRSSIAIEECGT
jgi:cell division protein FtsW